MTRSEIIFQGLTHIVLISIHYTLGRGTVKYLCNYISMFFGCLTDKNRYIYKFGFIYHCPILTKEHFSSVASRQFLRELA